MATKLTIGNLVIKLSSDAQELSKGLGKAGDMVDKLSAKVAATGKDLILKVTAPITAIGSVMVKLASDAEEIESKFGVVFSSISDQAQKAAKELDTSYGLAAAESKRLLSDTGDLLAGFGFSQEAALDMSTAVQKLAVDLASFQNLSGGAEQASLALTKALLGERESAKLLGIAITEEDVQARVLANKMRGLTFETERQAKAFATLEIAQLQSKNAIGDYARTQGSFANQMRELKADLYDVGVQFGKILLPQARKLLQWVRDFVIRLKEMDQGTKQMIINIAKFAAVVGPALFVLGKMGGAFGGLLRAASALGPVLSTVFGAMKLSSLAALIPLAKIILIIGAITAAVAGLAVWLVGTDGLKAAWQKVSEAVRNFVKDAQGFFANFRENITAIANWFRENWKLILKDVLRAFLQWNQNHIYNSMIMIETIVRLWTAWQGFMTGLFKRVFSVEFVKWIIEGIKIGISKFVEFNKKVFELIKNPFKAFTFDFSGFFAQLEKDFKAGEKNLNFFDTAKEIIKDQLGKLKGPLEGFESESLKKLKLNLTIPETTETPSGSVGDIPSLGNIPSFADDKKMGDMADKAKQLAKAQEDALKPAKEMTKELQFQTSLLGMSNDAREKAVRLAEFQNTALQAMGKEGADIKTIAAQIAAFDKSLDKFLSRRAEVEIEEVLKDMNTELKLIKLTNEQRERAIALTKFQELAERAFGKGTQESAEALQNLVSKFDQIQQTKKEIEEAKKQADETTKKMKEMAKEVQNSFQNVGESIGSAVSKLAIAGEKTDDILKNLLQTIMNLGTQTFVTSPLQNLFGGLFRNLAPGGGGGGLFGGLFGGGGGVGGAASSAGAVASTLPFGGIVGGRGAPIPRSSQRDLPAASAPQINHFNISTPDADSFRRSKQHTIRKANKISRRLGN